MEREAGPALDALLAERVFGAKVMWRRTSPTTDLQWHIVATFFGDPDGYPGYADDETGEVLVPAYSTTGDGCLMVIERMRALGWGYAATNRREYGGDNWFSFRHMTEPWHSGSETADTLPHAVALAALAALESTDGN